MEAEDLKERLKSVHRVSNLYSSAESIVSGALKASAGQMMRREGSYVAGVGGRVLCSWLLWKQGKRELDGLLRPFIESLRG